jgi:hypothetical protein
MSTINREEAKLSYESQYLPAISLIRKRQTQPQKSASRAETAESSIW